MPVGRAAGFVTFALLVIPSPAINWRTELPLDSTELLRIVGLTALLIMVVPGVVYGLRDRRRARRNVAIWGALIGVSVLLFWLMVRE